MKGEETERIYAIRMQVSITKASEEVLSKIFLTSFKSLIDGLKDKYYVSIERDSTEVAYNGALDHPFD